MRHGDMRRDHVRWIDTWLVIERDAESSDWGQPVHRQAEAPSRAGLSGEADEAELSKALQRFGGRARLNVEVLGNLAR